MTDVTGIDAAPVTAWMAERTEIQPPLRFELIAGGHSNLTYRVDDEAGRAWALRRPPLGHVLATAHDMGREHRIIAALGDSPVPVPPLVGLSADDSVNGAPFYVMHFVEGTVVRDRSVAESFPVETRHTMARSLVQTLAALHSVDPDEVGLGDLGRKEAYIERQLKRWLRQWNDSKTRELPAFDEVHRRLSEQVPEQGPAGIVHGDYRLDNCIVDDQGRIAAVLDWELCTLGDVLADLGGVVMNWTRPGDEGSALADPPTLADGFPEADEIVAWYGETAPRSLVAFEFYLAFSYWRMAAIVEGVYARYLHGAMGDKDPGNVTAFADRVVWLTEQALATLDQGRAAT